MGLDDEWALDASHLVGRTEAFAAVHMNHSRCARFLALFSIMNTCKLSPFMGIA